MYLILTPSKNDGRFPSQQGAPSACNLTYWEVSQETQAIGQNSPLQGGGGFDKKLGVA